MMEASTKRNLAWHLSHTLPLQLETEEPHAKRAQVLSSAEDTVIAALKTSAF